MEAAIRAYNEMLLGHDLAVDSTATTASTASTAASKTAAVGGNGTNGKGAAAAGVKGRISLFDLESHMIEALDA